MFFDDKYIDYSSKNKKELYKTLILFLLLSNRKLVIVGKYFVQFALKLKIPILGIIKKTIFRHFCGGETILESKKKVLELGKHNIQTILDYSIEGANNLLRLNEAYEEIMNNLSEAHINPLIPFCVFKITGIAPVSLLKKINNHQDLSKEEKNNLSNLKEKLDHICQKAIKCNTPILIDAEESWIQDAIDQITEKLMQKYNRNKVFVYNTIQLYRVDKLKYIKNLHLLAKKKDFKLGLKLVRGAYMEKEAARAKRKNYKSPIHKTKQGCDKDYNHALKYCIESIEDISLCVGTHNEQSTELALELMQQKKISSKDTRIYFSQLLGMSDNISFYLANFNYNVAKYVPYGPVKEVIPYLIRRAEENSAITAQTKDELNRIKNRIKNS